MPDPEATRRIDETLRVRGPMVQARGTITLAFHIIIDAEGAPPGCNVSPSQLQRQVAKLNSDYAETGFSFVVSSVDQVSNARWLRMAPRSKEEIAAKRALAISPQLRLNVYLSRPPDGVLGWSTFPWDDSQDQRAGVVLDCGTLPGGDVASFNLGATATHEIGHYLGLYHTFWGGCDGYGDYVADTPDEAVPAYGCLEGRNTCSSSGDDPVHNFMDYSVDSCLNQFTANQRDRAHETVTLYRPSLLRDAVAVATSRITRITPNSATAGGGDFDLHVEGIGFAQNSVVLWSGAAHSTTFHSSQRLTAKIRTNDIVRTGTVPVQVFTPAFTTGTNFVSGASSNSVSFSVVPP